MSVLGIDEEMEYKYPFLFYTIKDGETQCKHISVLCYEALTQIQTLNTPSI